MKKYLIVTIICILCLILSVSVINSFAAYRDFATELYVKERVLISEYLTDLISEYQVTVYLDGEEVSIHEYMGTGMNVEIINSKGWLYQQEVIVHGDISGDGLIKANDYMMVKRGISDLSLITGSYFKAANVNQDDKLSAADYMLIKKYISGQFDLLPEPPTTPTPIPTQSPTTVPTPNPTPGTGSGVELPSDNW